MARFTAPFSSLVALSLQRRAAPQATSDRPSATPVDDRRGPGWFDSSWDLQCGLEVCEGLPEDAGLKEWLETFCPRVSAAGPVAAASGA